MLSNSYYCNCFLNFYTQLFYTIRTICNKVSIIIPELHIMRYTLYIIATAVIVLLILTLFSLYRYATKSPYKISTIAAKQLLDADKFVGILDVRTAAEREAFGYFPGSYHVPAIELDVVVPRMFPDKSAHLLIYCNTGQRARRAAEKLQALGYKNTVYITSFFTELR